MAFITRADVKFNETINEVENHQLYQRQGLDIGIFLLIAKPNAKKFLQSIDCLTSCFETRLAKTGIIVWVLQR